MSDAAPENPPGRIVVHLVHGTWAANAPWTQAGSHFRRRLEERLRDLGIGAEIEFTSPQWGSRNRHLARLAGAEELRAEVAKSASEGVRQVLIGHSHGGSVCVLACKDADPGVARGIRGVVCLSTPFLVFRRAPYLRWMYLSCWVAWWMVAMIAAGVVVGESLPAALLSLPVPAGFAVFLAWVQRRGYRDPAPISAPASLPVPALLIRCPGDEASGVLGASLCAERILVLAAAKVASAWAWMNRHRLVYLLAAVTLGIVVGAAMLASYALSGSLEPLKWPVIVLAVLFATVLVVPLLVGWPLRALLYWSSYGFDVATRGAFLDVSAETTPPGRWSVHTIFPRPAESGGPGLAHREPYENDEAIDTIAEWVSGGIGGAPPRCPDR